MKNKFKVGDLVIVNNQVYYRKKVIAIIISKEQGMKLCTLPCFSRLVDKCSDDDAKLQLKYDNNSLQIVNLYYYSCSYNGCNAVYSTGISLWKEG